MAEFKIDITKPNSELSAVEYETKDVVDEKLKDLDTKLQKKIKSSTKDLKKEVNKVENSMKKVQDNFNKQIEEHNQKLECYIQKEKDVEYLKTVCKKLFKFEYIEMESNLQLQQGLKKLILKKHIKELKSLLKEYWVICFSEIERYIDILNPDDKTMTKQIVDAMKRIIRYNEKYGETL